MAKIKSRKQGRKFVPIECSYCDGYQKRILDDDDLAEIKDGTMVDFQITDPVSGMTRKVCDKCIRMINLENKVIMLLDHLLDSDYAKAVRMEQQLKK